MSRQLKLFPLFLRSNTALQNNDSRRDETTDCRLEKSAGMDRVDESVLDKDEDEGEDDNLNVPLSSLLPSKRKRSSVVASASRPSVRRISGNTTNRKVTKNIGTGQQSEATGGALSSTNLSTKFNNNGNSSLKHFHPLALTSTGTGKKQPMRLHKKKKNTVTVTDQGEITQGQSTLAKMPLSEGFVLASKVLEQQVQNMKNQHSDLPMPPTEHPHHWRTDEQSPAVPDSFNYKTSSIPIAATVSPATSSEPKSTLPQANVPSIRRILGYSDLGDFKPPDLTRSIHGNLAAKLVQRSTTGRVLSSHDRWPQKWKSPSWVQLSRDALDAPSSRPSTSSRVECLSWDPMGGVLLAVAYSNPHCIKLYDWDMVRAAEMSGKSLRQRHQSQRRRKATESQQGCLDNLSLPPILEFSVPHAISKLQWNPYQPDELAVGFKVAGGTCHLYQLDQVSQWIAMKQKRARLSSLTRQEGSMSRPMSTMPPPSCYILLGGPRKVSNSGGSNGTVRVIEYLDSHHVLVSLGSTVHCWQVPHDVNNHMTDSSPTKSQITPILKWRYQPPSACTCACRLPDPCSTLILLGTKGGQLCLVDWTITNRERNFSSEYRPEVLQQWKPTIHAGNGVGMGIDMGMVLLKIKGVVEKVHRSASPACLVGRLCKEKRDWPRDSLIQFGRLEISWLTSSGWLLSSTLESAACPTLSRVHNPTMPSTELSVLVPTLQVPPQVLYSPPKVEYYASDGTLLSDFSSSSSNNNSSSSTTNSQHAKNQHAKNIPSNPRFVNSSLFETYSVPIETMHGDAATSMILWMDTPKTTTYLSSGDKYVLDSQPRTVRCHKNCSILVHLENNNDRGLGIYRSVVPTFMASSNGTSRTAAIRRISVPSCSTLSPPEAPVIMPQVMAQHPGLEWLVLGIRDRLVLLVGRG